MPRATALGSLIHYITHADAKNFQPANITFDLLEPLDLNRWMGRRGGGFATKRSGTGWCASGRWRRLRVGWRRWGAGRRNFAPKNCVFL